MDAIAYERPIYTSRGIHPIKEFQLGLIGKYYQRLKYTTGLPDGFSTWQLHCLLCSGQNGGEKKIPGNISDDKKDGK